MSGASSSRILHHAERSHIVIRALVTPQLRRVSRPESRVDRALLDVSASAATADRREAKTPSS